MSGLLSARRRLRSEIFTSSDWSAAAGFLLDPRPRSLEGRGDIGKAGVFDEMFDPLLMAEALQLNRVLSLTEYDRKEEPSGSVV